MDPTYPLVPIANFLACVLVLLPLICTSIRSGSWNVSVTMFALWTAAGSIFQCVNAIIWSDNVNNVAPIWCDITTRIGFASGFALRSCTFLTTRCLDDISRCTWNNTRTKRVKVIYDLLWTVGLPILSMLPYVIVQARRYAIVEEEGCVAVEVVSGLQILLIDGPMLIVPTISALFYCPRILWSVCKRRKVLNGSPLSDSVISTNVYRRVMVLGCVDAVLTLPLSILLLVIDLSPPPRSFYPGWSKTHANFSTIPVEPANKWKKDLWKTVNIEYNMWINPLTAFAFFALFGLTEEARAAYRSLFWKTMRPLGLEESPHEDAELSAMRFGSVSIRNAAAAVTSTSMLPISSGSELSHLETSQSVAGVARILSLTPAVEEGPATTDGDYFGGAYMSSLRKDGV